MPTIFDSISDGFYTAFFEPDPDKRRDKIEAWIKESTPVIQSEIENDLRIYIEEILEDTWTEMGWKTRAEKFYGRSVRIGKKDEFPFIDAYKLCLDVKIRQRALRADTVVDTLTPEIRAKTLEAAKKALPELKTAQSLEVKTASSVRTANDDDDADEYEDEGRSSNDDRSDSMNPNNDSYQASMDNRSDQMNPNNDAYWSSRGR